MPFGESSSALEGVGVLLLDLDPLPLLLAPVRPHVIVDIVPHLGGFEWPGLEATEGVVVRTQAVYVLLGMTLSGRGGRDPGEGKMGRA